MIFDDLLQRKAERKLVQAGAFHVPRNTIHARSRIFLIDTNAGEPFSAFFNNVGKIRKRFDVVHDCRPIIETLDCGKRGLQAGMAALSFK